MKETENAPVKKLTPTSIITAIPPDFSRPAEVGTLVYFNYFKMFLTGKGDKNPVNNNDRKWCYGPVSCPAPIKVTVQ